MFEQLTNGDSQRAKQAEASHLYNQVAQEMNRPGAERTRYAQQGNTAANWLPEVAVEDRRRQPEADPWNQGKFMTTEDAHRVSRTLGEHFYDIEQDPGSYFSNRTITKREILDYLDSDKGSRLSNQQRADLVSAISNEQFIGDGVNREEIGTFAAINSPLAEEEITSKDAQRVAGTLSKYFTKIDKHGSICGANGYVRSTEIEEFLASKSSEGLTAREVMDLERAAKNADMIAGASNDDWGFESQNGITMKDLEKLPKYLY